MAHEADAHGTHWPGCRVHLMLGVSLLPAHSPETWLRRGLGSTPLKGSDPATMSPESKAPMPPVTRVFSSIVIIALLPLPLSPFSLIFVFSTYAQVRRAHFRRIPVELYGAQVGRIRELSMYWDPGSSLSQETCTARREVLPEYCREVMASAQPLKRRLGKIVHAAR